MRNEGKNVILEIEVQGCTQVREKVKDALTIFIVPPSMAELEKRIRGRNTEPEEIVQERLAKAAREMELIGMYKYVVCNDDAKLAADIIRVIIKRQIKYLICLPVCTGSFFICLRKRFQSFIMETDKWRMVSDGKYTAGYLKCNFGVIQR